MTKVYKITSVINEDENPNTIGASLSREGYHRSPGALRGIPPDLESDGSYRTGMNPQAPYIKRMSPEEQEIEKAYVTNLLNKAAELYGVETSYFNPKGDFYQKMVDKYMDTDLRCPYKKLRGGVNTFNVEEKKEDLVAYAYLRVNSRVAPSKDKIGTGEFAQCEWFVEDGDLETDKSFKIKTVINKATRILDDLDGDRRKKVGRQLGLPITDDTTEAKTYDLIDTFIKESEKRGSKASNATNFIKYAEMKDENLNIRDIIYQATIYNVLRKKSDGTYWRGENLFGKDYEAVVAKLVDIDNHEDLEAIENELFMKKGIRK